MDKRILIVDDNIDLVEVYSAQISGFTECKIDTAFDGLDAFVLCQQNNYLLICTDHKMPHMNGADLIRAVRNKPGPNQKTPILMISGYVDLAKESTSDIEDVIFLDKPVENKQFERYVRMAISQK